MHLFAEMENLAAVRAQLLSVSIAQVTEGGEKFLVRGKFGRKTRKMCP